jgi:hypothetical protein|tara:strand:- start:104 stop:346 length:243 start_codon:yes stop_codon:yes gene_type:complete
MKIFIGQKPDRQHMQALIRCKLQENEPLLAMFKAKLEEIKLSLVVVEEQHRLYRLQGQAQALSDFLEAVEKSSEVFERIK